MAFETNKDKGIEKKVNDVHSLDSTLATADTRAGTNLSDRELKRTAALVRFPQGEREYLPAGTAKYRNEVADTQFEERAAYEKTGNKIIEKMNAKMAAIENIHALILQKKEFKTDIEAFMNALKLVASDDAKKLLDSLLVEGEVSVVTEHTAKVDALQEGLKKVEEIKNNSALSKENIREEIQKIWTEAGPLMPTETGRIDDAFTQKIDTVIARVYTQKLAAMSDELTKTMDGWNIQTLLTAVRDRRETVWQDERDLLLTEQPERAAFLNRIAGTPTAEELIKNATVKRDNVDMIDVRYLAFCIRYARDAKKQVGNKVEDLEPAEQLEELKNKIGVTKLYEEPTDDIKKKIANYVEGLLKPVNPAGIDAKHLLLRLRFEEKIVNELIKDQELLQHLPLKTLLLFRGMKPDGKITIRESVATMIAEKDMTIDDLLNVLTFLAFPIGTGRKWEEVKAEAKNSLYDHMIAVKLIEENTATKKVKLEGEDDAERLVNRNIIEKLLNKQFSPKNLDLAKSIATGNNDDLPWEKDVEFMAQSIASIAGNGIKYWYEYVKKIPNDFRTDIKGDDDLMKAIAWDSALSSAESALRPLRQRDDKGVLPKGDAATLEEAVKALQEEQKRLQKAPGATSRVYTQHGDALELVKVSRFVHNQLKQAGLENLPVDQQNIAFWIAIYKDVETAKAYMAMQTPDIANPALGLSDIERADIALAAKMYNFEQETRGSDSLLEMKNTLGVSINIHAMDIMEHMTGDDGLPLGIGAARMDQWFINPHKAAPALNAILVGDIRAQAAMIRAFVNQKTQTYKTPDGEKTVTLEQARDFVKKIQTHLQTQKEDYRLSLLSTQRPKRFGDPLDVLKNGGDALMDMFQSGDRTQQLLAGTIVASSAWLLYRLWTKGGTPGKAIVAGVPLFFGADVMLRKITGKGMMERFGLQYMNEQDRTGSVEEFRRQYQQMTKYSFLETTAGGEAMRALTSSAHPIPVEDLIAWRLSFNSGLHTTYRSSMPNSKALKAAVGRVMGEDAIMNQNNNARSEERENACMFLFLSFEALCEDLAERNKLGEPKAELGAEYITARYVTFSDESVGQYAEGLKYVAEKNGHYTMLDVLTRERPTPAVRNTLFKDDTFLEWVLRGTGITVEEAKKKLAANISFMGMLGETGAQLAPEYLEMAHIYLSPKAKALYDYLLLAYTKNGQAIKEEAYATLRLITTGLTQIGILVTQTGPDAIQWTWESGVYAGRAGVNILQNLYYEAQKLGKGSGPGIDLIDGICESITGYTMSHWVLNESALATADPSALNEQVDVVANEEDWKRDFIRELETITNGADDVLVSSWITEATQELLKTNTTKNAYHKMAVYELVKRRVYSFVLQTRNKTKAQVPMNGLDLKTLKEKGANIESVYGLVTLRILEAQTTDFDVDNWGLPGAVSVTLKALLNDLPQATFEREDARQYLVGLERFYDYFHGSAETAFPGDTQENVDKRKQYDAFLQTVLTNAVIDMTLRAAAGQDNAKISGSVRAKVVPPLLAAQPFALQIAQAKGALDYLRAERGNSADATKLKDVNLSVFADPTGNLQTLNPYIPQKMKPALAAPAAGPIQQSQIDSVTRALDSRLEDTVTLQELLVGLKPGYPRIGEVEQVFDRVAKKIVTGAIPIDKEQALVVLQGTTNERASLEKTLLDNVNKTELAQAASTMKKSGTAYSPEILTEITDKAVVLQLDAIFQDVIKVPTPQVLTTPNVGRWEDQLVFIYKASDTPRIRDTVSQLLEYVKYQLSNNGSPDGTGLTFYPKYLAYLKSRGITDPKDLPPDDNGWVMSPNSKGRMNTKRRNPASVADINTTWSGWSAGTVTNYGRTSWLGDKLQILKSDMRLK